MIEPAFIDIRTTTLDDTVVQSSNFVGTSETLLFRLRFSSKVFVWSIFQYVAN